jgi:Leucine-rich repeat (LRR) protein
MEFNIETYLDSLHKNITELDVSKKNLTYLPSLTSFKKLRTLNCMYNKLTSLPPLNPNLQFLWCSHNKLTSLPSFNEKLVALHCSNNKLTSLPPLNEFLTRLYCDVNKLTSLPPLNNFLIRLWCNNNQLTSLPPLNEKLEYLYCRCNHLTSLPYLNEKLKISCENNPMIITGKTRSEFKKNIEKFNNFRHLYYSLKFKNKFRHWLWSKVREPKAMKKYHPDYLLENLYEDTDLDEVLDKWI